MKRSNGFTLIEILIAVTIFVVVMTVATSIFVSGMRTRAEGAASLTLEREGSLILERIMRGLYGKGGLREADRGTLSVSAGGTLVQFTVDRNQYPTKTRADDITSMVYLVGGKVYYKTNVNDPATVCISGSEGTVDLLRFTPTATGVDIVIALRASLPGTDREAFIRLTKSVTARN